jgi:hypothetical protein
MPPDRRDQGSASRRSRPIARQDPTRSTDALASDGSG